MGIRETRRVEVEKKERK